MRLRTGLVVVISDFFDPRGLEPAIEALRGLRHRLLLVQLTRPSDRDPSMQTEGTMAMMVAKMARLTMRDRNMNAAP